MQIFEEKIYLKSIDRFFPRVRYAVSPHNCSADNVIQLSNVNIFDSCKCNISIYTKRENAFYMDLRILNQSEKKDDLITSFLKTEKKLDNAYGKTLIKQGRLSWLLFKSVSSKRKINHAIIEHYLYEHFTFCERITVKFV